MPILENAAVFFDSPVRDYRDRADWVGPDDAYRLRIDRRTDPGRLMDLLDEFVLCSDVANVKALVIGAWGGQGNLNSYGIVRALVRHRERFANLAALFLGDIATHEMKISWIQNSDVGPLLKAFPKLEVLRVRGGQGLRISRVEHHNLRALILETGGLSQLIVRDLAACHFPRLVHLELWLGARSYGWDGSIVDLHPILDGSRFPKLKHLGLRNSEIVDQLASAIVQTPILWRLNSLDLSLGNLTDAGGRALWGIPSTLPLRSINVSHHYLSPWVLRTLQTELRCKVIADEPRRPVNGRYPIFASE